ncbi:MAG: FtsX-like permease family protein [Wenzhouxiangellaceae bacterium]|nr:FtsX-like permease family protein [Wenzhouxiangellaceae bacterium]
MNVWSFSFRLLFRQGRSGSLWMLIAGLAVATAALAAVSLFTDRVGRALERQAAEILAADVVVRDRAPLPERIRVSADELGLATSDMITLQTVLFSPTDSALFSVKAVSDGYPLRGRLRTAAGPGQPDQETATIPAPGEAWIAPEGLRTLDLAIGDRVQLGERELEVTRLLTWEPDRGGGPFLLTPRLLVNRADLEGSSLLGAGSRANYRLLLAGSERQVERFIAGFQPERAGRMRLETPGEEQAETDEALEQARRFLAIAALTAVILSAVAVLLAALRFATAQRDLIAMLKALGAESGEITRAVTLMLLWLVAAAVLVGAAIGWIGQAMIAEILATQMRTALPQPRLAPLAGSGLFTLLLAIGFALPPLLALRQVPPMRILNRSLDQASMARRAPWLVPILAAFLLPAWELNDWRLAVLMLGGSALLAGLLALSAWGAMYLGLAASKRASGAWRFGLAGLSRRRASSIVQVTALGLGLMALLLLAVVRGELIGQWQATLPANAPDHFMVNIQPDQADGVRAELEALGAERLQVRPMANVQLVAIDGDQPPENGFTGQVNVSWIDQLPPANEITEGAFWSPGARGEISVAQRWADRVGVRLGDVMTFDAGGSRFTATVTSIRNVQWNSFNVNFFLLLTPEAGEQLPHQYVASFWLPEAAARDLDALARELPNVSVLDVGALIQRVFEIITQVSQAAQVVFAFTLIAGLVVLLAALEATRDERRTEAALIRALGADNATVRNGVLIEYAVMAVIAGLLATAGAALTGWIMADELFNFAYRPGLVLFVGGFALAGVLVVGAGWLGNRSVLRVPPVRILRAGAD